MKEQSTGGAESPAGPRALGTPPATSRTSNGNRLVGILALAAVAAAVAIAAQSWAAGGLLANLLRGDLGASAKVNLLRAGFLEFGLLTPLVYVAFRIVEVVVAPIPGTLLYAPG